MKYFVPILIFLICSQLYAQSLFEDAVSVEEENYELSGYIKCVLYGGKVPEKDTAEVKSGYAEASLKFKARKQDFGEGFAEIRFRSGCEYNEYVSEVNLREAYINTYIGCFDFRIGRQIVVWGRADGFNPTNIITPQNMLIRSPEEDDRREGNFLVRSFFNLAPFRTEFIWVPYYSASTLPLSIMSLPSGMSITDEPDYPDSNMENGAFAVKLNLELASFDASVSYFNGFNPFPGMDISGTDIIPTAYRMHSAGADFSTTISSYGLRGEFAFRYPYEDYEKYIYIPNPDLQYVLGIDREFGDFSIILQYIGRYVFDFAELSEPGAPPEIPRYEIEKKNRIFSSQQDEISHALSFRPALIIIYETLTLEIFGLYNFTTEELLLRPVASYDIAGALTVTLGGDFITGPEDTMYGIMDSALSSVFVQLRASF